MRQIYTDIAQMYYELAVQRSRGLPFISDWNGAHPYIDEFVGDLATRPLALLGRLNEYAEIQQDVALITAIADFHERADGTPLRGRRLLVGGGATSMLALVVQLLREERRSTVLYLAPLHYTMLALLERENIEAVRVSSRHAFEAEFDLDLPEVANSTLVLSDPIWFAGRRVPEAVIAHIRDWQERTSSLVVVDGTFQYLGWTQRREWSARLHEDLTIRLVCPTKALCLNGFRLSYLILPEERQLACANLYDLFHGGVSMSDQLFARAAITALNADRHVPLLHDSRRAYEEMSASGWIQSAITPECGYFAFVRPNFPMSAVAAMGPAHFQLSGYEGWIRVNLLHRDLKRIMCDSNR